MSNPNTYWRSPDLGEAHEINLPGGPMRVFETGSGPAIVFVHGALVNANLWRKVVPQLSSNHRCVTLDMPLGSHELPVPDADLSPTGLAARIAGAIAELELEDVTLVGNDTGGGLSQIVVANHPERIGRLLLTSVDAFEQFPPALFKYLLAPPLIKAAPVTFGMLKARAPRKLPIAYGWLMHSKLDPEAGDSYVLPVLTNREVRADTARYLGGLDPSYLLDAATTFASFEKPVTIAWSKDDKFFWHRNAERLAQAFPDSQLEWIENSRTFSPEDQPEVLAKHIAELVERPAKKTKAVAANG
jgi:pimeloyl-ACP methyl ester carboxylesterase